MTIDNKKNIMEAKLNKRNPTSRKHNKIPDKSLYNISVKEPLKLERSGIITRTNLPTKMEFNPTQITSYKMPTNQPNRNNTDVLESLIGNPYVNNAFIKNDTNAKVNLSEDLYEDFINEFENFSFEEI